MNDPLRIWARKGETVTCINDHPICDIARDIHIGAARAGTDFTNWRQPEPAIYTLVSDIRCIQCRTVWIRGNIRGGYQFHFADGWR